jgi:hypothetical protein
MRHWRGAAVHLPFGACSAERGSDIAGTRPPQRARGFVALASAIVCLARLACANVASRGEARVGDVGAGQGAEMMPRGIIVERLAGILGLVAIAERCRLASNFGGAVRIAGAS